MLASISMTTPLSPLMLPILTRGVVPLNREKMVDSVRSSVPLLLLLRQSYSEDTLKSPRMSSQV